MSKFENNVQFLKYKILKEIALATYNDTLETDLLDLSAKIVPGPESNTRCCIYKGRAIVSERAKMVLGGNSLNKNIIEVIDVACDECSIQKYSVTEACRGCLAHRCKDACPFDAIEFEGQKAKIAYSFNYVFIEYVNNFVL